MCTVCRPRCSRTPRTTDRASRVAQRARARSRLVRDLHRLLRRVVEIVRLDEDVIHAGVRDELLRCLHLAATSATWFENL